ncbi:SDR family NAD(P)-dependent oxidoreductase [Micrococcales bacterium 31B]|nr:SDR family NAD(P)-dependent oxidoreductase [Micrococcales bacterium 31B]
MSSRAGASPRRALVTGGAAGIGFACAERLAATGVRVTIADLRGADEAAARLDGADAWQVDLTEVTALEGLALEYDILVNNAGMQNVAPVQEFDPAAWRRMHQLMVEAPFLLIRACLPHMYARGFGRIINVSSVHGLRASAFKSAYVSAKHALEGLSKVVALEGGPHGVTSNCVNPGYVRTALVENQIADQARIHGLAEGEVLSSIMLKEAAVKRLVEPAEVAGLVEFLASDAAGMMSGGHYTMDGGWSAR